MSVNPIYYEDDVGRSADDWNIEPEFPEVVQYPDPYPTATAPQPQQTPYNPHAPWIAAQSPGVTWSQGPYVAPGGGNNSGGGWVPPPPVPPTNTGVPQMSGTNNQPWEDQFWSNRFGQQIGGNPFAPVAGADGQIAETYDPQTWLSSIMASSNWDVDRGFRANMVNRNFGEGAADLYRALFGSTDQSQAGMGRWMESVARGFGGSSGANPFLEATGQGAMEGGWMGITGLKNFVERLTSGQLDPAFMLEVGGTDNESARTVARSLASAAFQGMGGTLYQAFESALQREMSNWQRLNFNLPSDKQYSFLDHLAGGPGRKLLSAFGLVT